MKLTNNMELSRDKKDVEIKSKNILSNCWDKPFLNIESFFIQPRTGFQKVTNEALQSRLIKFIASSSLVMFVLYADPGVANLFRS